MCQFQFAPQAIWSRIHCELLCYPTVPSLGSQERQRLLESRSHSPSRKLSAPSTQHSVALRRMDRHRPLTHTPRSAARKAMPVLSSSDFSLSTGAKQHSPPSPQLLDFDQLDTNKDGVISREEFISHMSEPRLWRTPPSIASPTIPDSPAEFHAASDTSFGALTSHIQSADHKYSMDALIELTNASLQRLDGLQNECNKLLTATTSY